jgi:prepilin-type N-terminal cleavage/methylation domain-containing protein
MKIHRQNAGNLLTAKTPRAPRKNLCMENLASLAPWRFPHALAVNPRSGFTMVEIAICLAIIGFALIAIIGALPIGMGTQRDNREETLVNQDATVLLEAIRGGARGLDNLTNYVYAITNNWTSYNANGVPSGTGINGYTYSASSIGVGYFFAAPNNSFPLTNGLNVVGLLGTPEFVNASGGPIPSLMFGGYSNHIVAYVHSISGPAIEKPPQDNDIVRDGSFGYRVLCVNAPVATDMTAVTNVFGVVTNAYFRQLAANLHELRLAFFWPQLPNGNLGPGHQSFRTLVAGQIVQTSDNGQWLYFYQSQSFVNVTNAP